MTLDLIRLTLRSRRLAVFWFSAGMFAYALLTMALWPMSKSFDFAGYLEAMPKALQVAFGGVGLDSMTVTQRAFFVYLSSQLTTWMILITAYFGVWVGAGLIVRDYDLQTLDLLLAQPVGRVRFLLARCVALAVAAAVVVALSLAGLVMGLLLWGQGTDVGLLDVTLVHVQLLLFTIAAAALGLLAGAVYLEPGRAYGVAGLVLVAMFVLNVVAQTVESISWLAYLALFGYWRPLDQLVHGGFGWRDAGALLGVTAAALLAALLVFRRRDIAT